MKTSVQIQQMGQLVLDYLMNDPKQQDAMESWVQAKLIQYKTDPEEVKIEDTAAYNLYYALTTEWHTKVLAEALLGLTA